MWPERGVVQVYNPKGQDKLFTYDAAYDSSSDTQAIYDEMVSLCLSGSITRVVRFFSFWAYFSMLHNVTKNMGVWLCTLLTRLLPFMV